LIITIISQLFNKKYGLTMSQQLKMQEQVRTLQQRMSDAQRNANPEELRRIQQEMMQISKDMMMKTMLPSLVRCAFFWIVYAILNYYYKNVSFNGLSFFWIYFLYSLGIGLIFWLITKKFGKKDKEKEDELLLEQEYNKHMKGSIDFSGLKPEIIEEIMETKRSLEEKKKRGELAADIDIDAEIQRMINENLAYSSNLDTNQEENNKIIGTQELSMKRPLKNGEDNKVHTISTYESFKRSNKTWKKKILEVKMEKEGNKEKAEEKEENKEIVEKEVSKEKEVDNSDTAINKSQ
ncbi:MAG: hypothetical protein ACTSXF_06245, partial [Promethearchaeota archaeon]